MARDRDEMLAEFAARASAARTVDDTVEEIVGFGVGHLSADYGGMTLWRQRGRLESAGATDLIVEQADKLQHTLREGPCVQAVEELRHIVSPDVERDSRWPVWGPQAADLGLRSILSVELTTGPRRLGALNFYGATRYNFTEADIELAHLFSAHAAAALEATLTAEGLRTAVDTRTMIGQAQGILMERYSISAKQAFSVLLRYSQDNNIKLYDLARRLIDSDDLDIAANGVAAEG
ncbi:GAF and ANTAR domain-containing protein [Microlunatus speluncae]|uniref:GAF and ANTAR domain-containing protein n=1 Tax=Microlunatus speluncae TaxID=2594267 RepID=UPI0012662D56|nr:GAF and ANTAR domain-containing protein [Microlunatus speluncae]